MRHLGQTRSVLKHDHLLQTPDAFVRSVLPGMIRAVAIVHCGPTLGAGFTQYTVEMESESTLGAAHGQRFVYCLDGEVAVKVSGTVQNFSAGGFAYIPEGEPHSINAHRGARLSVIEKPYVRLAGRASPGVIVGLEASIQSTALMGDEALRVRALLPNETAFDFAVNTMTYQPGASLSMVEIHVMEHGCLMLEGGGIYRLGDSWYSVEAGDFIWMKSFCPQWFGALGKTPAKYLIYKDWNRWALACTHAD